MTTPEGPRILGHLRAADGTGVVHTQDRFDTSIDDLWSALTDPRRLGRWLGEFDGDLRLGGEFHVRYFGSGAETTARVEMCEPPLRFRVVSKDDKVIEATLTADGDATVLTVEHRGLPVDRLPAYGAGIQIHVEDLAAHLAGQERCDSDVRMGELYPAYRGLQIDAETAI
ncbi:hypothetical protein Cs7R123_46710 [Catellatospora sp. TT07R-123]|uniref:SRPBCC domain-containing protein n=1 Tax=Catellatospora sp. TT07R-123 TaxID=2733863 RepID=UPI001B1C2F44|nr:SRPBCC domain-containing protein [Catellatospora sp. TT07R-123]GHJ47329.1 hypothetical protein Cs7R123_46710 [Catellatospora sp. TT07R-123]